IKTARLWARMALTVGQEAIGEVAEGYSGRHGSTRPGVSRVDEPHRERPSVATLHDKGVLFVRRSRGPPDYKVLPASIRVFDAPLEFVPINGTALHDHRFVPRVGFLYRFRQWLHSNSGSAQCHVSSERARLSALLTLCGGCLVVTSQRRFRGLVSSPVRLPIEREDRRSRFRETIEEPLPEELRQIRPP